MTRNTIFTITALAALTTNVAAQNNGLMQAITERDTAAVRHQAMLRSDVDVTDDYGNTALMIASAYGYDDVVAILVHAGADVNATGRIGNTALIVAVQNGHTDVARQLLDAEALVDVANDYGTNARELAMGHGHRDITALLNDVPVEVALATPVLAF
ncbi:MAG: ankyrin repeat domain-containing protein [Gemmatimonadetes bacterium]|jgi:ankyrin repeat protein|nr:ankyrin repeat domain-containing protein [Gemmatimonadota bacterium]MBT5057645.1 ankyrin repeat domain-containing protein [Gemmatimonadota bacterium]MBT5146153.1 ankyrin repeat domain-containing protein [Gemmatimonadota bacterium]MBT5587597.1 ankyrin repeat domain-containing protein [Gemmatimonadota bacterium]MBT5963567.1 ankyrin repeat domain-containing protein [Gemmatimonadota bacterium]